MPEMKEQRSEDRLQVQGYGPGYFAVAGDKVTGSVLLASSLLMPWSATDLETATAASLQDFLDKTQPEILLLGTGKAHHLPPKALRDAMVARGIALDHMDSGAACRTYNVLMLENRAVAAALLAI